MPLLSRSAALLADLARAYGAADQIEDASYLDAVIFRSYDLCVVYNPARDVFSFDAALGPEAPKVNAPARRRVETSAPLETRKIKLRRPGGEDPRLRAEVPVAGLTFPEFSAALDVFLEAVAQARMGKPLAEGWFAPPESDRDDDLIWIRP